MKRIAAVIVSVTTVVCIGCGRGPMVSEVDAGLTPVPGKLASDRDGQSARLDVEDTSTPNRGKLEVEHDEEAPIEPYPELAPTQGMLGFELETELRIEGVRKDNDEFGGSVRQVFILVDTVNGQKLETPVVIEIENIANRRIDLPVERRCILRGHETGKMIGSNAPVAQMPRHFHRYFVETSVEVPYDPKIKSPDSRPDAL